VSVRSDTEQDTYTKADTAKIHFSLVQIFSIILAERVAEAIPTRHSTVPPDRLARQSSACSSPTRTDPRPPDIRAPGG
jgi:hypothetical protein